MKYLLSLLFLFPFFVQAQPIVHDKDMISVDWMYESDRAGDRIILEGHTLGYIVEAEYTCYSNPIIDGDKFIPEYVIGTRSKLLIPDLVGDIEDRVSFCDNVLQVEWKAIDGPLSDTYKEKINIDRLKNL